MAADNIDMILEPKKRKSVTAFTFFPSIGHEVMGLDAMILVFWVDFHYIFLNYKDYWVIEVITN